MDEAQCHIMAFLGGMLRACTLTVMTSKFHGLSHMLDDCRNYGVHAEAKTAYDFESLQAVYSRLLRTGYLPLPQLRSAYSYTLIIIYINWCILHIPNMLMYLNIL